MEKDKIQAIMVLKIENKQDFNDCEPPLTGDRKLKICLFKVSPDMRNRGIGSSLLNQAISFAKENNLNSIYLSHFARENDDLVRFLNKHDFYNYGKSSNNEDIFVKDLNVINIHKK